MGVRALSGCEQPPRSLRKRSPGALFPPVQGLTFAVQVRSQIPVQDQDLPLMYWIPKLVFTSTKTDDKT